jgi:5-methylcytosine-specific restriction endonuclease McrA
VTGKDKPARSGRRRRGGKRGGGSSRRRAAPATRAHELTSHPTTRNAYVATREWLLKQYGPICAYCGTRHSASKMTLDHVAPRRGQTAYDRRDNLVLACQACNQIKKDQSPLAFLLGMRSRAVNLVKFGAHLSSGLLDMARDLVPGHLLPKDEKPHRTKYGESYDDDSPYRD